MATHVDKPIDLLNYVGHELGTTTWLQITQSQVDLFADVTGDHQWIHTDPERAATGPFGRTIAHGFLVLSLAPRALSEILTIGSFEAALNYGLNKVRFPSAAPVGSRVRTTVQVESAEQKTAGVEVIFGFSFNIDTIDRPVCVAELVTLYR